VGIEGSAHLPYIAVLAAIATVMRYVVRMRNPVDVAHYLAYRDGFSGEKSSNLWPRCVNSALQHSAGQPRLIIFHENLMNNWPRELQRLADFPGNSGRAQQMDVRKAVQVFIKQGLQHYRTSIPRMMTTRKRYRFVPKPSILPDEFLQSNRTRSIGNKILELKNQKNWRFNSIFMSPVQVNSSQGDLPS
jgi:hypothetical protein